MLYSSDIPEGKGPTDSYLDPVRLLLNFYEHVRALVRWEQKICLAGDLAEKEKVHFCKTLIVRAVEWRESIPVIGLAYYYLPSRI